jgi:hypothetical protein
LENKITGRESQRACRKDERRVCSVEIIIVISGKTALFEPKPSLEDFARLQPGFSYLDFETLYFLQSKVFSPTSNPQLRVPGPCSYVPQ